DQALVAAVVGLAHRGVHAYVGGDAGEQDVRDALAAQHQVELGRVERALARLVDQHLTRYGRDLRHDLPPGFATHQDAPGRPLRADLRPDLGRSPALVRGQVGEVRGVPLPGVDDQHAHRPGVCEQPRGGRQPRPGEPDVVAHPVDVATGAAEVDLPV